MTVEDDMSESRTGKEPKAGWSIFPPSAWLREYKARWLMSDALAGVTLAAYAVPVSMAYAGLAGLPPVSGIYCYLFAGVGFFLMGSSRHLAVGPTSAIAMLIGTSLLPMAGEDAGRLAALAAATALLTALICFLAWLLRLSQLVYFISETNLVGFKAGAALTIASTQLPKVLGVPGGGDDFFSRMSEIVRQLGQTNPWVLGTALAALLLLWFGERYLPGRPVALAAVILAIVAAHLLPLAAHGVKLTGELPAGLPRMQAPDVSFQDLHALVPLAFACFLLMYVESIAAGRTFALKHKYRLDPRQELMGLGLANAAACFGQGFVVAGGLSQTAVNEKAGAKTPLALPIASLALVAVLLFLTAPLALLPQAILGAIVLMAVKDLIKLKEFQHLWKVSRFDFAVAVTALAGVLLLGILEGVLLAMVASILMLLRRASRPHVAFLGRIPGTQRFSDFARHADGEKIPGLLAFRVEAPLLYMNSEYVTQMVLDRVSEEKPPVRLAIWDLSSTPNVDVPGARAIKQLGGQLKHQGVELKLVEAHAQLRDLLRAEGLEEGAGGISRLDSLAAVSQEYEERVRPKLY